MSAELGNTRGYQGVFGHFAEYRPREDKRQLEPIAKVWMTLRFSEGRE